MTEALVLEEPTQELRTRRAAVLRRPPEIRIAAIADTHGLPFLHPLADVFIHAGDMTAWGEWPETAAVARELGKEKYEAVLLVPGNHDNALEQRPQAELFPFLPNTHLLIDKAWEYRGLLFYGSPWTPYFEGVNPHWRAFMGSEDELRQRFRNMPEEIDVLITHGPPRGVLDNGCGSEALRDAVERRIVRKHIFGRLHEQGGRSRPSVQRDGSIRTSYNVAAITGRTQPATRDPAVIVL